jgi:hypothetical protein
MFEEVVGYEYEECYESPERVDRRNFGLYMCLISTVFVLLAAVTRIVFFVYVWGGFLIVGIIVYGMYGGSFSVWDLEGNQPGRRR